MIIWWLYCIMVMVINSWDAWNQSDVLIGPVSYRPGSVHWWRATRPKNWCFGMHSSIGVVGGAAAVNWYTCTHTLRDICTHLLGILYTSIQSLWTVPLWTPWTLPVLRAVCCELLWLYAFFLLLCFIKYWIVVCSLINLNWILPMCTCKYCKYLLFYM